MFPPAASGHSKSSPLINFIHEAVYKAMRAVKCKLSAIPDNMPPVFLANLVSSVVTIPQLGFLYPYNLVPNVSVVVQIRDTYSNCDTTTRCLEQSFINNV